jgi:transglutaminase-like putative cysteine protease
MVGGMIIAAWLVGLGLLIRREYFQPRLERLAEAGHRVAPGVVYYGVMQGERLIGFASSTVDTSESSITIDDYFVADLPMGGKPRRASARTNVTLSRALRMRRFNVSVQADGPTIDATGEIDGDSVLVLSIGSGKEKPEKQRIALSGPILLPTLVPLAIALGDGPKVGRHYVLPVFDPSTMTPRDVGVDVRAESLFVVDDSAVVDSATQRWRGVLPDTIRAWQVTSQSKGAFTGWIDDHGRIMQTTELGLELRRMPYEVAFSNWRADTSHAVVTGDRDILETTAIAANKRMDRRIDALRIRLSNVELNGFDLNGQRQRLAHDTLVVSKEPESAMVAPYQLSFRLLSRPQDSATTRPEPLLQSTDVRIVKAALRIRKGVRDPRVVAEKINAWVHDSIKSRVTFGVPNALEVLRTRTGDCNEHTQLFVALARAIGLPARIAAGLAYVDGKFYYHAWPEVLLGDWVPVDPTFGQFPADAAHIRFVIGGLPRQTELLRLMGNLKIDVLSVNPAR